MRSLHFGSAMVDTIALVATEDIERLTLTNEGISFLMVETGRKLPAESITTHIGGGACNTAVCLRRRGWQSTVVAKVGTGLNAAAVRQHLVRCDVESQLIECDSATGSAVMVASHDRNASIFVHRGANELLSVADLPEFDGFDLVYVAPLSSGSADCFPEIVRRAKAAGARTAANPGIRQLQSRSEAFLGALPDIDLLSVNRPEADALVPALMRESPGATDFLPPSDPPALVRRGLRSQGCELGLAAFMHRLRLIGPKWISLTDGNDGAYLCGEEGVFWQPNVPTTVAGTAGAGDAFCSTVAACLMEGMSAEDALLDAALNASAVVSVVDTTAGLLKQGETKFRRAAYTGPRARRIA